MSKDENHEAIEVRDDIPLPLKRGARAYPFDTMEVGQSFLFPAQVSRKGAMTTASLAGKRFNRKFATRTLPDGRVGCWREG